ncbi:hypothetical protein ABL78_0400 [Leptomonas seymouri]|uniref:Uncharacterized protein n=1 Tax=Leptomonas seymouri TaxID=5684 RepID=A0A0N1PGJ0_LEPSE|nr:hypothetical protein ABL78_0400 [Leptomonas seymouri]|eukprot:KPI90470.1 hypothetical protein ABL78_0400 [Leptomonas seymouri]
MHSSAWRCSYRAMPLNRSGASSLASPARAFNNSSILCNLINQANTLDSADAIAVPERVAEGEQSEAGRSGPINEDRGSMETADSSDNAKSVEPSLTETECAEEARKMDGSCTEGDTQSKREVAENETEAEVISTDDTSTPEAQSKRERLLDAETSLLMEEMFARDEYQKFIHTTEVRTAKGLRWLDVSAAPGFFEDPRFARIPEGEFALSVMRRLYGSSFPSGVYAGVASGMILPATYVSENWACLILCSAKEVFCHEDAAGGLFGAGGGIRRKHRSFWQWLPPFVERRDATPAEYGRDNTIVTESNDWSSPYGEATSGNHQESARASPRWDLGLRWRLRSWRLGKHAAKEELTRLAATSERSSVPMGTAAALRHRRHSTNSRSPRRSPLTMSDFTDRLTVFIGKEMHPVEQAPNSSKAAATVVVKNTTPVLSCTVDCEHTARRPERDMAAKAAASSIPDKEAEDALKKSEVRWHVVTVHRSSIPFLRDIQSQWNKLTSHGGRSVRTMRSVPGLNEGPLDTEEMVKQALRRAARPVAMVEEEEEEGDAGRNDVRNTMVDRVEGWEDLVRLLYHGATRTLRERAYRNARRLEVMEAEIFDTPDHAARYTHSMTRLLAELHLLSRESTIHNAILRESKVAYQKLKRVLDGPDDLVDQRELLYVDSVLSITAHLEEQSASLLFLQFSAAMNQTGLHLRTLTIFSTLFIPLDFICSCFGSGAFSSPALRQSEGAMYAVFGLMATTAFVTLRWIRHNLR